jgi:hypothetical protein
MKKFDVKIQPAEDGRLSTNAKRALVPHELTRRNELPSSAYRPMASQVFPVLSDNTAAWVNNQQARGHSEWPWFSSALKFLNGYGQEGTDFEKVKAELLAQLEIEIKRFNKVDAERSAISAAVDFKVKNERNKLIGGLGGIHSDSNPSSSYWDTVDAGHWREQE